ncbi:hypothetical protein BD410DRAFT_686009, partial [Rickenella mellea]
RFKMSVKEGLYDSYKSSQVNNYITIQASNRFFSRRDQTAQATPLTFSAAVDPKGILSAAGGRGLVHLEDNLVQYYVKHEVIIGEEKISRFESVNPSIFRPGQLVEMQVSFALGQVQGRFKMFIVLRSIAMLSDEHLQVSCLLNRRFNQLIFYLQNAELASVLEDKGRDGGLKRRIGYEEEEEKD